MIQHFPLDPGIALLVISRRVQNAEDSLKDFVAKANGPRSIFPPARSAWPLARPYHAGDKGNSARGELPGGTVISILPHSGDRAMVAKRIFALSTDMTNELMDREMIRDCLYRYCRGIDRADEAALRSAYWPDGTDHHGSYQGSAEGFIEWALQTLPTIERGIHQIHNILIEFRDGGAAVESYFTALQRQPGADGALTQWHMAGRYVDWFEKRAGDWRVARRVVAFDWKEEMALPPGTEAERFGKFRVGGRFPDDPIYELLA